MDFDPNDEKLIEAAIMNAGNFGSPLDMWHPDYGWILVDHKLTEAGHRFVEDNQEQFNSPKRIKGTT